MVPTARTRSSRLIAGYVATLGIAGIAYLFIRDRGMELAAAHPVVDVPEAAVAHTSTLASVLLALALVTVAARALGALGKRWLNQPAVMGEILAGLLLGPSALGAVAPGVAAAILPTDVAPHLGLLAKVGVVFFMFLVGLELDTGRLRRSTQATLAISHASIVLPFLLGAVLALWLYPRYGTANVDFTTFSLFTGISLSVTAFPVLARILSDRKVQHTQLGVLALSCAAVDDVTAWCLLAVVVGIAQAQAASAVLMLVMVIVYLVAMFGVVRPALGWLAAREDEREGPITQATLAGVFVALLLSAWATESLGIHALFGAFLVGALLPHEGRLARQLRERIEDIVVVLFLPAFFAFTGLRTEVSLVSGLGDLAFTALIIGVATVGKFGGSFVAARWSGLGWRGSAAIGVLMNTRGLMELVVLNVGLDLGVISPTLFAMFVIMALVTTFATTPILDVIMGRRGFVDDPEPLEAGLPSP